MDEMKEYLQKYNFSTQLKKLNKKLKGKTVIIYGSGLLFKKIQEFFDLSQLNIIGVSDGKYTAQQLGQKDLGYNIIPKDKIIEYKPDFVLIATVNFLDILKEFRYKIFAGSSIKVLPFVDKPFFTLLKEMFS